MSQPARFSIALYEPYIFNIYGNSRYILDIFSRVNSDKFKLTLVAPYEHEFLDRVRKIPHADAAVDNRVEVLETPAALKEYGGAILHNSLVRRFKTALALVQNSVALYRYLKNRNPDLVQCHSIRSIATIGIAARLAGVPILLYIKGELANPVLDCLGFLLATKILFQSARTRDAKYPLLRKLFSRKISILPNGIDIERLDRWDNVDRQRIRTELAIDSTVLNFVCTGQVSPYKGIDLVIEAFCRLHKELPPFHLYIVGDPVLQKFEGFLAAQKRIIQEAGLESRISFLGWREDAPLVTSVMDVLIHASLTEGVPKAVLEALAQGVPVVATNVGGTADVVITDTTGELIPAKDVSALINAIRKISSTATLRNQYAEQGRSLVRREHGLTLHTQRLENLYQSLRSDASSA